MGKFGDKVRVVLNAAYRNGVALFQDKTILADAKIRTVEEVPTIRVIELRFAVPTNEAESLLTAFQTGDTELNIEGVRELA